MRNRYVVCYDVSDPDRCRRVHGLMQGYGDRAQYSVFLCELNGMELTYLKRDLAGLLNLNEDRALIVDTGPAENDATQRMVAMGTQSFGDREPAIIV